MPLLIDGHNLIGAGVLEGINLEDEDDEQQFVSRLRVWRSNYRGKVTVVFDRGITGGVSRELSGGGVEVIFARNPQDADDLILLRIKRRTPGLTVVTNDGALRKEAALYDVETWRADEFVRRIRSRKAPSDGPKIEEGAEPHVNLSNHEVSEWIDLFGAPPPPVKRPRPKAPDRETSQFPKGGGQRSPGRSLESGSSFDKDKKTLRKRLQRKQRRK